jgi:DnaJ family protein C protein 2
MMVDEHHGFQKDAKEQEQQQEPGLGFRVAPDLHTAAKDEEVEKAWSGDEIELLKKQLLKHPRGTLQRWEVIAKALGGAHRVEPFLYIS